MFSRLFCNSKIENFTFSVSFSIDISALLIVLVKLEGKLFRLCFSTFNISSETTFEASLMIEYLKNVENIPKSLE